MFSKILTAFDGSIASEEAYALALEFAERYQCEIHVLFVARPPEPAVGTQMASLLEAAREFFKGRFDGMKRRADARKLKIQFDIAVGHPAETILEVAQRETIDLIIMGRRGKNVSRHWPLGTVSDRVITYAQCAVLAVT